MSAECPPKLFEEFEASCGDFVKPNKEGLAYIYEVFFNHFEHANAIELVYPRLPEATFTDWKKFEYWCDEIKSEFISHISPYGEDGLVRSFMAFYRFLYDPRSPNDQYLA